MGRDVRESSASDGKTISGKPGTAGEDVDGVAAAFQELAVQDEGSEGIVYAEDQAAIDENSSAEGLTPESESFYSAKDSPAAWRMESNTSEMSTTPAFIAKQRQEAAEVPPPKRLSLRITDVTSRDKTRHHEVFPNTRGPFEIENHMCKGRAILKIRTEPLDPYFAPYFEGKKRMFEIMVEGKLKQISPDDRIFVGMESDRACEVNGFFANAAAQVVMTLIEFTTPNAHCVLGDDREVCQLVFPLDTTADRFIVSGPDEEPPEMGVHMFPELHGKHSMDRMVESYTTDNTYSFSIHSMYLDLANWQFTNLPGIGSIDLDAFFEGMPLRFVCYTLPKSHEGPHLQKQKNYLFSFELDHTRRHKKRPQQDQGFFGFW